MFTAPLTIQILEDAHVRITSAQPDELKRISLRATSAGFVSATKGKTLDIWADSRVVLKLLSQTREERLAELQFYARKEGGLDKVRAIFNSLFPPGTYPPFGAKLFETILAHEYGEE